MFSTLIIVCFVGYGIKKLAAFARNNPEQSMEAMRRIRQMFGK